MRLHTPAPHTIHFGLVGPGYFAFPPFHFDVGHRQTQARPNHCRPTRIKPNRQRRQFYTPKLLTLTSRFCLVHLRDWDSSAKSTALPKYLYLPFQTCRAGHYQQTTTSLPCLCPPYVCLTRSFCHQRTFPYCIASQPSHLHPRFPFRKRQLLRPSQSSASHSICAAGLPFYSASIY